MASTLPVHETLAKAAERTASSLVGWRIERLRTALDGPLAVVAAGQTHAAALLWARLHEAGGHPAWAMTPYDLLHRGVSPGVRVLVLSVSGRHHDLLAAARLVAGEHPTIAVTCDRSAPLARVVRGAADDSDAVVLPRAPSPASIVPMAVLAARVYAGMGSWVAAFRSARPATLHATPPRTVVCVGAGLAYPAAYDFAARCLCTGFAPARATDIRNLAHAESASYDPTRDWLLAAAAGPEQRTYIKRATETLPDGAASICLESDRTDAHAALELLGQSIVTFAALEDPSGDRPDWATRLSRLAV